MKKILFFLFLIVCLITLASCKKDQSEVIVSDGSQASIFESISDALKEVFE